MMMEMFVNRFPEAAEKETRCIILPEGNPLPAGNYYMAESFCNDKKCDCRRAFINVIHNDEEVVATIGFGWEDLAFYRKWAHGDKDIAVNMKGPILELTGPHTKYSEKVLVLFKEYMMHDEVFLERLKQHYKMFKEALERDFAEYGEKTNEMPEKYKRTSQFPEAQDMEDSKADFGDDKNAESGMVFNKDVLKSIEFASLFRGRKESVVIDKSNTAQYEPLLMAIEQAIYDYCQESASLKDRDVIDSLKAVRDNICGNFEEGSLEQEIVFGLKAFLLAQGHSQAEVLACVSKVLNSAKLHRAESGSRGYLSFISEFFEHPGDFEGD